MAVSFTLAYSCLVVKDDAPVDDVVGRGGARHVHVTNVCVVCWVFIYAIVGSPKIAALYVGVWIWLCTVAIIICMSVLYPASNEDGERKKYQRRQARKEEAVSVLSIGSSMAVTKERNEQRTRYKRKKNKLVSLHYKEGNVVPMLLLP